MPMFSPHGRPRTDALHNREKILRVADDAFREGSEVVPLEEIARRAGLGRATVYRHFPDRQALGLAVTKRKLRIIVRIVKEESARHCEFREVLTTVLRAQVAHRPLVRFFRELPERFQRREADGLVELMTPSLRRAQAAGIVRRQVEPADLLLVFQMVETALDMSADHQAAKRMIDVIVDGFLVCPGHSAIASTSDS
ncbi:TetR/AcrR family transcriptional regulator [Actinophytocola oryzae]|uniref:TetR family transcriptional regulator n=1 Tax=Actinophytocola oryzae TaxID=502181 RepID=A0A4R7VYV9_9PSEU|nr:TetR/AcrR family transcriptional regulator [Actinophytocola oryzae]TDV55363.1 TetR family transcriptional regulator [Actinophytocola oryzae]